MIEMLVFAIRNHFDCFVDRRSGNSAQVNENIFRGHQKVGDKIEARQI